MRNLLQKMMSIKITSLLRITVFIILAWCIGIVPTLEGNAAKKGKEISQKNISKKVQPSVEPKPAVKKDQIFSNSKKKVKKINETDEIKSKGKTAIGKTIEVISVDPWAPIGATDIGKQSKEEVEKKSLGCNSCHQGVEKMHVDEKIKLGCTDCHGGNAGFSIEKGLDPKSEKYLTTQKKSHIQPKYPDKWPTSANPVRSYTLLNKESREFIRFMNPGDLRVAETTCGGSFCHQQYVANVPRSIMSTGAMLFGGASYNNGILPFKNYVLGEYYTNDGKPAQAFGVAVTDDEGKTFYRELTEKEKAKGAIPSVIPLPRWEITKPGNIFRSFERGGRIPRANPSEVGVPGLLNTLSIFPEPGKPDMKTGDRGLGTQLRIDTPTLNIHKTRLNDPLLWFLGTNDHPGDFRSSGCSSCHVVYANSRDKDGSGPYSKFGHRGLSFSKDPTIPKDERGHPISHRFTNAIPTSQCLICHMHQPNAFVNTYLGYTMWDYETDAKFMYPEKTPVLTPEELAEGYQANPEGAVSRGLWRNEKFLEKSSEMNSKLKHTQMADYHGHGWMFRGVFKKDRKGNLLDKEDKIVSLDKPDFWEKAVHLKDVHVEKGMHCVDCHFSQDSHGDGKLYGAYKDALEIQCVDCHGDVDTLASLVPSGPAATGEGDLRTGKSSFGKKRFFKRGKKIYQRSMLYPDREWEVPQVQDFINPESKNFNEKARYAKTIQRDHKTWGAVPDDKNKLAHSSKKIACYTCHTGFVTNCFGCHLPLKQNFKEEMRHFEGNKSKVFTTYNPQVLRDDSYMLARWGKVKNRKIAPARSSSALIMSALNGDREMTYIQQPPISSAGYSSQAFNPHYPHNVRKKETKKCDDCHISEKNDNNAWMASLFLHGTNFVNFFGKYIYLGLEHGLEAVAVTETEEPQAVIGSHTHKYAYPAEFAKHLAKGKELENSYGNSKYRQGVRSLQLRGEYLYTVQGKAGFWVYDVANIDNKGYSQRIVQSPFSSLGQSPRIVSRFATSLALPTNMPVDANRKALPENEEASMHPIYKYAFFTDRYEGLIGVDVTTFLDGNPKNNFLKRAFTFNPDGLLKNAEAITLAGVYAYISCLDRIQVVNLNDPLNPKLVAELKGLKNPRTVAIQFRYGFVVDDEGLKVFDVTIQDKPKLIEGAIIPLPEAYDVYVARTYAYVAGGKKGLIVVDIENPEKPKLILTFDAEGKMNDVHGVRVGSVSSSSFAFVADGNNGLRVIQLSSPGNDESGVAHFGFSPLPKPKLVASKKLDGRALTLSKGLDRDRAIDESGNQVSVFGRLGAMPLSLEDQQRMYLEDGKVWRVTNEPANPPIVIKKAVKKKSKGKRKRRRRR